MNQIAFATKRAFHALLRGTRRLLASYGITAARFDMLYVIGGERSPYGQCRTLLQSELVSKLGVSRSVVSRMVRALEGLGLVKRQRALRVDGRTWSLSLTEKAESMMRVARRVVIRCVHRLVIESICFGSHRDPGRRFLCMSRLEETLGALRRDFGDRATLYFPWGHPDD